MLKGCIIACFIAFILLGASSCRKDDVIIDEIGEPDVPIGTMSFIDLNSLCGTFTGDAVKFQTEFIDWNCQGNYDTTQEYEQTYETFIEITKHTNDSLHIEESVHGFIWKFPMTQSLLFEGNPANFSMSSGLNLFSVQFSGIDNDSVHIHLNVDFADPCSETEIDWNYYLSR